MSGRSSDKAVVLLVEDQEDDALLTKHAFSRANIRNPLHIVTNGTEAIAYLQGRDNYANRAEFPLPDLMLLDINMPNGDGFTVLRWVRAHPGLKVLRIVMLTTSDESSDIDSAYLLGANSYLVKPLDFEAYVKQIGLAIAFWFENSRTPTLNRAAKTLGDVL
jgi:CheY-like chemotaxis protein